MPNDNNQQPDEPVSSAAHAARANGDVRPSRTSGMSEELSPHDHVILNRVAELMKDHRAKTRSGIKPIGDSWAKFLEDKPRGDPRIQAGAKRYGLETPTLHLYVRATKHWMHLEEALAWADATDFKYNGYEAEPRMTIELLEEYVAQMTGIPRMGRSDKKPNRLDKTIRSDSKTDHLCGDSLDLLKTLPGRHFHVCVTSPPYWRQRDFGPGAIGMEASIEDYTANIVAIFHEVRRIMRDDGVVWMVIGDRYASRARKAGANGCHYHAQPALQTDDPVPPGNLLLLPDRIRLALQADGWIVRSVVHWDKVRNANAGVSRRPLVLTEDVVMLTKHQSDYFYYEPPDESSKPRKLGPFARRKGRMFQPNNGKTHHGNVIQIAVEAHQGHTSPFPKKLARWCVQRTCPVGGCVIDPFSGSGTVGVVAKEFGIDATLIEINPVYVALAKRRLKDNDPRVEAAD